jgi:hypothetical protein
MAVDVALVVAVVAKLPVIELPVSDVVLVALVVVVVVSDTPRWLALGVTVEVALAVVNAVWVAVDTAAAIVLTAKAPAIWLPVLVVVCVLVALVVAKTVCA